MNDLAKRGRGRPRGTGLNDNPTLTKMADMIILNPRLRATTALKCVLKEPDASTIRRIQAKWRGVGQDYLEKARARQAAASSPGPAETPTAPRLGRSRMAGWAISEAIGLPALPGFRDMGDDPTLRALREAYDNPTMRAVREVYDSPTMKAMRELYDSPTMRAMRELHDSSTMRVAREMQATMRLMGI
jgi:hypothetical protein